MMSRSSSMQQSVVFRFTQICFFFWYVILLCALYSSAEELGHQEQQDGTDATPTSCADAASFLASAIGEDENISMALHHNGEPDPCGIVELNKEAMIQALLADQANCDDFSKYQLEAFMTRYVATALEKTSSPGACHAMDDDTRVLNGLRGYCDMGPGRTVIQHDHAALVRLPLHNTLPCRWFTREGLRISNLSQLVSLPSADRCGEGADSDATCDATSSSSTTSRTIHLYAVPAGRVFMFAPSFVGEEFSLDHVRDSNGDVVSMKVLSTNPRVLDITNFFSKEESEDLVHSALQQTDEVFGFHRSTTGAAGASVFDKRTSENAWDTTGPVALAVKRRGFQLLGLDDYHEPLSDGLQILRYNLTTAYTPHMDYLEDRGGTQSYDYDSAGVGGNRFATILLYFTELEEGSGGETVFPKAWPPDLPYKDRVRLEDAIQQLRASDSGHMLQQGSWQEEMVAQCRTRLSVRPTAQRAVLFYSQFPNGKQDPMSFHGGCPVLNGTKLAANLWTWSGIRPEYDGAPRKFQEKRPAEVQAVFRNSGDVHDLLNAELFYNGDVFFGKLGHGDDPIYVNSYEGHQWHLKVQGEVKRTFTMGDADKQTFEV